MHNSWCGCRHTLIKNPKRGGCNRGGSTQGEKSRFFVMRWYFFWRRLVGPSLNALLGTRRVPPFVAVSFFCFVFLGPGWHVTRQAALSFAQDFVNSTSPCHAAWLLHDPAWPAWPLAGRSFFASLLPLLCAPQPYADCAAHLCRNMCPPWRTHLPPQPPVKQASFARFLVRSFWAGMLIGRCSC